MTGDVSTASSTTARTATASDAMAVAQLLAELGYPAASETIPTRIARLSGSSAAIALVAEQRCAVVGLATGHAFPAIHVDGEVAWLTALVVGAIKGPECERAEEA